jgi:hypothetical protein
MTATISKSAKLTLRVIDVLQRHASDGITDEQAMKEVYTIFGGPQSREFYKLITPSKKKE